MTSSWSEEASRNSRSRSSARPHPPSAPVSTEPERTWAQRRVLSSIPLGQTAGRMPIPPVWWSSATRPWLPPFGLRPKVDVARPEPARCAVREGSSRALSPEPTFRFRALGPPGRSGHGQVPDPESRAGEGARHPAIGCHQGRPECFCQGGVRCDMRAEVVPPPPHCRQERPFVPQDDGKIGQVGLPEPARWSSTTGGPARHT